MVDLKRRAEIRKFVNDWLWASPERQSKGMPWPDEIKTDVVNMIQGWLDTHLPDAEGEGRFFVCDCEKDLKLSHWDADYDGNCILTYICECGKEKQFYVEDRSD